MSVPRAGHRGIVVLGVHRGGTSLVAELVQRWGAYGREEELVRGDVWNERGYWEYAPLVDFNEELLRTLNSSWNAPPGDADRPALLAMARDTGFSGRARRLLADMQVGGRPWFWKDPRLPVLLPFWKQVWGDVRYVVPVRDPVDISLSLGQRYGLSMSRSLLIWQRYMSEILLDPDVPGAALFVSYERLLTDGIGECSRLCSFLDQWLSNQSRGRAQRPEIMARAIVPDLRRNRATVGFSRNPMVTPAQKALQGALESLASGSADELAAPPELEPRWREHLVAENAAPLKPKPNQEPQDSCEVFWRDSNSEYVAWRSRSVLVKGQPGPQKLRIGLPPGRYDGVTAIRIDLSQRAGFAKVLEIAIEDARGNVVWGWDGRPESIQSLFLNQIRICSRQPKDGGCMLRLHGDDPWLEVILDASQSAALAGGAAVVVECEYIPSWEYVLQKTLRWPRSLGNRA